MELYTGAFMEHAFDTFENILNQYVAAGIQDQITLKQYQDYVSENLQHLGTLYKDMVEAITKYQAQYNELSTYLQTNTSRLSTKGNTNGI